MHHGESKVRQAPGDRADDRDSVSCKVQVSAGCGCADYGDQRAGHFGSEASQNKDGCKREHSYEQRRQMHAGKPAADLVQLHDGFMRVDRDAEHLTEHGDADLKSHAGEKADEHCLGEKVSDEAKFEQARQE